MLLVRMLGIAAPTRGHTEGSLWLKKEYYRKFRRCYIAELFTIIGQRKTAWKH